MGLYFKLRKKYQISVFPHKGRLSNWTPHGIFNDSCTAAYNSPFSGVTTKSVWQTTSPLKKEVTNTAISIIPKKKLIHRCHLLIALPFCFNKRKEKNFIHGRGEKRRMWLFSRKGASGFSGSSTAEEVTQGIDGTGLTAIVTGHISSGLFFGFVFWSFDIILRKKNEIWVSFFLELLLLYYQSIVENMGGFSVLDAGVSVFCW